jgi:1,4-alpha-glucan branching enzyme
VGAVAELRPTPAEGFGPVDRYLLNEGTHLRLDERLGGHLLPGRRGARFALWAPNAREVSVLGDFNDWRPGADRLEPLESSGVFEGVVREARRGMRYKYRIESRYGGYTMDKADPVGLWHEVPPGTASVLWELGYRWRDEAWMRERGRRGALDAPLSIYEVHLGSWRRVPEEEDRALTYRELQSYLVDYVREMGFTHVEFLPVMEHPFFGSWGYQPTGLFAPTARQGTPQEFMGLIDALHRAGVGVFLDWVPGHFPRDAHGLAYFDGTHLYEHADPRQGYHPEWNTHIYNFGRPEVRSFLGSSASFWLRKYHVDGLRVDAVASMLYLDYSRAPDAWVPNAHGGHENEDAIRFLRWLNEVLYASEPGIQTIAEESTAWPMVSRPTSMGGLGFGYKWDLGWMHDTLEYLRLDPVHRRHAHGRLTFRMLYAYTENFVLPLSHDEVVHLKGSLLDRMPGDPWQQFANLRLLFGYQFAAPGKKLLFMGDEFAQGREWHHDESLDWHLLGWPRHAGVRAWVKHLLSVYRAREALYALDYDPAGFLWIEPNDADQSVLSFLRRGRSDEVWVAVVLNCTPVPRPGFRIGVPRGGAWEVIANGDAPEFGGSGVVPGGPAIYAEPVPMHGHGQSIAIDLPPLAAVYLAPRGGDR